MTARLTAKAALVRPAVIFDGWQARAVARGFADYCSHNARSVHALAILSDHAHLVVGRCGLRIEKLAVQLKSRASMWLHREGLHPFRDCPQPGGRLPTPWAGKDWHVFLSSVEAIERAIKYVQDNPMNAGLRRQWYDWVLPYRG